MAPRQNSTIIGALRQWIHKQTAPPRPVKWVGSGSGLHEWLYSRAESNDYDLRDRKYDLALAYLFIEPVRSAINLYVDAISQIPVQVVRNDTGKPEDDLVIDSTANVGEPRHPALKLFDQHEDEFYTGYWEQQILEWMLYDEIATELIRPVDPRLQEIARRNNVANGVKVLRGASLTVEGWGGELRYFFYDSDDSHSTHINPKDVAYKRGYHPTSDYIGSSNLLAVLAENNIIRHTRRYALRTLKKAHRPDVFASPAIRDGVNNQLTDSDMDTIERQLQEYRNDNTKTLMLLGSAMDFATVAAPNVGAGIPVTEDARKAVYRVYHVNPELVGDSTAVNYKADAGVFATFVSMTAKPAIEAIFKYNNKHIFPQLPGYDKSLRLKPDLSGFDVYTEPEMDRITVVSNALNSGNITYDEWADKTGLAIPEELKGYIKINNIPVPLANIAEIWEYQFKAPAAQQMAQAQADTAEASTAQEEAALTEAETQATQVEAQVTAEQGAKKFDPNQPRDENGQFDETGTAGGGGSSGAPDTDPEPVQNTNVSMSNPEQKKPEWSSPRRNFTVDAEGYEDYGFIGADGTINPEGLSRSKALATEHKGQLTFDHVAAVEEYTMGARGITAEDMNEKLRGGVSGMSDSPMVQTLDDAISRTSLPNNTVLYRGLKPVEGGGPALSEIRVGDVIQDPGYSSTSLSIGVARDFAGQADASGEVLMRIKAPKGTNALSVQDMSDWNEYEVLLPRDTEYVITGIYQDPQTGGRFVEAEVAEQW